MLHHVIWYLFSVWHVHLVSLSSTCDPKLCPSPPQHSQFDSPSSIILLIYRPVSSLLTNESGTYSQCTEE